ncbi:MAG: branched-chain amino acid ABC transporter permease [Deltaproteobacteria bacterium]|nr:branched-chain amino acid ABC transporter permease [Deltaproteobacteria bacterium]
MENLIQTIVVGLSVGGIYGLVALGFTIVYRSLYVINFAQGHVFMVGSFLGYVGFSLTSRFPVPVFFIVLVAAGVIGIITTFLIYRKIHRADHLTFAIASIGVGIVMENIIRMISPDAKRYPDVFGEAVLNIGGIFISKQYMWVLGITLALIALLQLFFYKTKYGKAMRAVSENRDMASLLGINVPQTVYATFIISSVVGAVAGILIGPIYFFSFDMGFMVGLKAFSAAILGGIMSVPGTLMGGFILGMAENLGGVYVSSGYKDAIAFGLLIFMLMVKPTGLFGKKK